jgi:hypothetical protein
MVTGAGMTCKGMIVDDSMRVVKDGDGDGDAEEQVSSHLPLPVISTQKFLFWSNRMPPRDVEVTISEFNTRIASV